MATTDIPIHLDINQDRANRRRSNSQSQVVATPKISGIKSRDPGNLNPANLNPGSGPTKRKQVQYFVTLTSLNDTFVTRHISVPYFPDTRKLGRPTGSKIKPDVTNGFFDSRVLSRNHAIMYIDPASGKLMLKDLGSSNGTYVNNVKLDTDAVEIKMGDNICFGFNIQVGINHKQISCKVENISIMNDVTPKGFDNVISPADSAEFKHYQYIQDLYNKISIHNRKKDLKETSKKSINFESALFSDINPEIEENLLGLHTKANNGIFKNSGSSTSTNLENSISQLINCSAKLKQQTNSLVAMESFLSSYKSKLDKLNDEYIEQQINKKFNRLNDEISNEKSLNEKLMSEFKYFRDDNFKKLKKLEEKIYLLKDEKLQLNKKIKQLDNEIDLINVNTSSLKPPNETRKLSLSEVEDEVKESETKELTETDLLKLLGIETSADSTDLSLTDTKADQDRLAQIDEDTDLRYQHNYAFLAVLGLIFAYMIHHSVSQ